MTESYQGHATVLVEDFVADVTVSLRTSYDGRMQCWRGVITGDSDACWRVFNARGARLRLPDEREGNIIGTNFTVGSDSLEVTGSGPAPF